MSSMAVLQRSTCSVLDTPCCCRISRRNSTCARAQALNERKVEIRVQYKPPVQMRGGTVSLDAFRNELVMRCVSGRWLMTTERLPSACSTCFLIH